MSSLRTKNLQNQRWVSLIRLFEHQRVKIWSIIEPEQEVESVIKLLEDVLMSLCTVCKVLMMFVLMRCLSDSRWRCSLRKSLQTHLQTLWDINLFLSSETTLISVFVCNKLFWDKICVFYFLMKSFNKLLIYFCFIKVIKDVYTDKQIKII